jgi:hypothetical protein
MSDFTLPIKTFQQKINDQFGRFSGEPSSRPENPEIPEIFKPEKLESVNNPSFFKPFAIDGSRWDKLFPYRLLVVDASKNYSIVPGESSLTDETFVSEDRFNLSFQEMGNRWELRLPITPQQLSIVTPYAIDTTATFRGIVEEHNGVKFKIVNMAGTMGVWPFRPNLSSPPSQPNILSTMFAGSIEAFEGLKNQVNRVIHTLTQNHPANKPTTIKPGEEKAKAYGGYQGTGYYHAMMLDQFLDQYAEAKRDPAHKHWRLVLDIPKQNRSFIVTPVIYEWNQSEAKPNEISYRLQFKAWKRVDLNEKVQIKEGPTNPLSPDLLTKIINAVNEARFAMASAYNLIQAVRSDFQTPFNVLREISLFAKDLYGIPAALADLPRNIIHDAESAIRDVTKNINTGTSQLNQGTTNSWHAFLKAVKHSSIAQEGVSNQLVSYGNIGSKASIALRTDPVSAIFENPEKNFEIFNEISTSQVLFSQQQQIAINKEMERIRQTSVDDLIQDRSTLLELTLQISNVLGAGDDTYNSIYRRPNKLDRIQKMNIDEFDILKKIYDVIQALDELTSTDALDDNKTESAYEYVGSLASDAGIPYDDAVTKIRVPVPFGLTMEQIAMRYLGNPDKWIEIAALNALRSPHIDENGFYYNLLSNANGRQFTVNSSDNLFIGQKIILTSINQAPAVRRIINLEKISDSSFLITVDGLDDLDVFTLIDEAKMQAFLPGTVNSSDQIFIPSNFAATDTIFSRPIPATQGDPLVGMSKVDILLDGQGDIALNSFGEMRLAAGISNLIQALKMKFSTPTGRLIKHPEYGAGLFPGISTSDVRARDIYNTIKATIEADPRFSSIQRLEIDIQGPKISVSMSVTLANGNGIFPISFNLNS